MIPVLVVDDEKFVREGIVQGTDWKSVGCEVVGQAKNGEEALALARTLHPVLIVTDIRMPKMDGIELVRTLREEKLDVKHSIEMKDITYAYPNTERLIFDHADLKIPVGASVGIVGTSGAGKSTVVDIRGRTARSGRKEDPRGGDPARAAHGITEGRGASATEGRGPGDASLCAECHRIHRRSL